jgi:SnoaL-like domain
MLQNTNRRAFLAAAPAGAVGALGLLAAQTSLAADSARPAAAADNMPRTGGMARNRYLQYVNWFNEGDPRYLDFYHPDVVLELGNATINGANGIRDFYKEVHAHIHEKVEVTHYVADATGIAVELPSEFKVYKDWPLDNYFHRPLKAGEVFRIISLGMYEIDNGKFRHIKTARYKLVNDWRMEG